ncbi:MAG: hypothetical protein EA350_13895 [Gemmatimonadales bacterium]|nr:MAG: hypothetical protein EA350_13895 [Gemmatimonadales bacterium]
MDCNEFLDRYSEFHDDETRGLPDRAEFEGHIETCSTCARYHRVVVEGTALLRESPAPPYRDDFHDRLQHRIYQSDLDRQGNRESGLAYPVPLGLAAAILVAVVAWGPVSQAVTPLPPASLPTITASVPSPPALRPVTTTTGSSRAPAALVQPDFWSQSHTLLYEHSPLYHRNRSGGVVRTGLQ